MKTTYRLLAFLIMICGAASAQVVPTATGPGGPRTGKNLQYALRYSQTAEFSPSIPTMQTSTASGSLTYANGSERNPFTMEYGGGYTWTLSGPTYGTGQSQRLYLSQGINWRQWKFTVDDDASYLPQSPTTGFLGIPGIGEPIGVINPSPTSSQTILTLNTHAVENAASGNLDHSLNTATTMSVGGSSLLLRYPDGNGLDTDTLSATGTLLRLLNGRNSLSGTYLYSNFSYPGYDVTFETNAGLFGYQHKWTRNFTTDIAAGPEWISSTVPLVVPNSTNVTVNATATYVLPFTTAGVGYTRRKNGGAGTLIGAEVDTVTGNFSRQFGLDLTIGLTGGYERTASLNSTGVTNGMFGGAQGTWRIGRNMIVFANYTGADQSSTSALPTNALNQLLQTIGFGIGFSPRPMRVRQ